YKLGEFDVTMKDGIARMDNGSLAGSTLLLIDGVRNLHHWSGESLSKIWHLASLSPAKSLEMDHNYGSIAEGKVADVVGFKDDINVQATVLAREVLYEQQYLCLLKISRGHYVNKTRKSAGFMS